MSTTTEANTADPTVWHLLPDRWRQTLRAKALSSLTERDYLSTVRRWADWLVAEGLDLLPDEVRARHIDDFIAGIVVATSAANAAFHYRNLRVYFGWLVKREEITGRNPMVTTEAPKVPEKLTPVFTAADHTSLVAACAGRDKAMLLLFRDTGARVSELACDTQPGPNQDRSCSMDDVVEAGRQRSRYHLR